MDIRLSPPREGVRGGREQFKWDEVKKYLTKEREHYLDCESFLGHSVKIGMIEHKNKFYKHDWYMKDEGLGNTSDAADEMKLIKLYEDELMQEMLGAIPKRLMLLKSRPTDVATLRTLLNVDNEPKHALEDSSTEAINAKTIQRNIQIAIIPAEYRAHLIAGHVTVAGIVTDPVSVVHEEAHIARHLGIDPVGGKEILGEADPDSWFLYNWCLIGYCLVIKFGQGACNNL
ncbi:hypothetical protein, conserved [Babesia bigemina]|uniref:Multiple myeloma tumor-associated protein 2-like N-terminal domain-containing protein n=1 Tax=Babesia bigemina TaxID=5866 RepID=A0A061DB89_BABBI|nr:hypothetical protein, conserved [Babesia bigemina]CDR97242.1 hypothetical protein, conserved [Babesia bigemina]|eukprot:XP_012769428.1 hypothetical protein, conserved [Babesia bigemina]